MVERFNWYVDGQEGTNAWATEASALANSHWRKAAISPCVEDGSPPDLSLRMRCPPRCLSAQLPLIQAYLNAADLSLNDSDMT